MIVYWSPWADLDMYPEYQMAFDEPQSVLSSYKDRINHTNQGDNFFKCPAFLDSVKNMYSLNAPWDVDFAVLPNGEIIDQSTRKAASLAHLYHVKNPSMYGAGTVNVFANWIMFSDEPVTIQTSPAYLHKTSVTNTGFYVPGKYDISQWFRPIEAAFQLWPMANSLKCGLGEPMLYVNFLTNEPIEFKRFYMTPEIHELSMACVKFKQYQTIKNLDRLYAIFTRNSLRNKLLTAIKDNLI